MRFILIASSLVGLALTVVPSFLVFSGTISWQAHAQLVAIGTVIWFVAAPAWMAKKR